MVSAAFYLFRTKEEVFINKIFYETLVKTHSPIKATHQSPEPEVIEIYYGQKKYAHFIYNFHSVDWLEFTNENKMDKKIVKTKAGLIYKDVKPIQKYIKIDNLTKFVNSNSLAGKYKDSKGELYVFDLNGHLVVNNKKIAKFEIDLDDVFNPDLIEGFSLVFIDKESKLFQKSLSFIEMRDGVTQYNYSYYFDNKILKIYSTHLDLEQGMSVLSPISKPLVILYKI
jgi:hypothetical protein